MTGCSSVSTLAGCSTETKPRSNPTHFVACADLWRCNGRVRLGERVSRLLPTPTIEAPAVSKIEGEEAAGLRLDPTMQRLPVGESVTRGALALLSTQPLTWAGSLLTTIAAPRLLGAEALGQFTIVFTIATLAATATSLGVSEYLVRRVAQSPTTLRHDAGVALLVQTITTLLGALVIAVLGPLGAFSLVDLRLLYIGLLIMLITPAQTVLLSSFRGRELHRQYAWFNAVGVVAGQVVGVVALLAGGDVFAYTFIVGASAVASTVIGWKLSGLRPTLPLLGGSLVQDIRDFIWGGFPFLTWNFTLAITSGIDRVLLGLFVPAAEVGWYAAAYRIFAIPLFIPTLIMTPLFPALSRSVNSSETIRRTVTKTVKVVLMLMVPMTAGIIVVAPAVPSLFGWPADFGNAVPLMIILSIQLPIIAVDMVFGVVLLAVGRQGPWVVVGVIAAAAKVILDFLAIPVFENLTGNGAVGASVVTLVTEALMFGGALILMPRHLLDPQIAFDAARITIAGVVTVLVGALLLPIALAPAIVGGGFAYIGVAVVLRALTLEDVRPAGERFLGMLPKRI
jgi:O-antigen/teichoic acid export membrane protein